MTPPITFIPDKSNWVTAYEQNQLISLLNSLDLRVRQSRVPLPFSNVYFPDKYSFVKYGRLYGLLGSRGHVDYFHGRPDLSLKNKIFFKNFLSKSKYLKKIRVSNYVMQQIMYSAGLEDKTELIHIGVDVDLFSENIIVDKLALKIKLGIPTESFVLGSFQKDGIGWRDGFEPKLIKGPDLLIQTARLLKEKGVPIFVLLSGPCRGYVVRGLKDHNIPFHWFRDLNYCSVAKLYGAIDSYLVSSRDEGGPKAILESMASGIPIVSTPVGQAVDLINDGLNGYLLGGFSPEEMAVSLEAIYQRGSTSTSRWSVDACLRTAEKNSYNSQKLKWLSFFND